MKCRVQPRKTRDGPLEAGRMGHTLRDPQSGLDTYLPSFGRISRQEGATGTPRLD